MFREFILPCYKKLTSMLRDHGVKIMVVDSDGYNWKLIPLFIQGGVTGMGRWRLRRNECGGSSQGVSPFPDHWRH